MYEPPPWLTTWKFEFGYPASHGPGWMLRPGGPALQSANRVVSIWKVTLMPRAGVESARLKTNGTLTHGNCGPRHAALVFAATTDAGGVVNTSSV